MKPSIQNYGLIYKGIPQEIGETASGKKIMDVSAENTSGSEEDHLDAAKVQGEKAANIQAQRTKENTAKPGSKPNLARQAKLQSQEDWHAKQKDAQTQAASDAANKQSEKDVDEGMEKAVQDWADMCQDLLKGGAGSGLKGHTTARPGGMAFNSPKTITQPAKSPTMQWHELPQDHSMSPNLKRYKKMLKVMGPQMEGHFTYSAKDDKILAISDVGRDMVKRLTSQHSAKVESAPDEKASSKKP